jgi:Novel STAND NTPase 1
MWTQMVKRGDGVLRLPAQSFELGGVLSERADAFLAKHPNSEDALRRILTLKLATVREGEEPTRRRALRSEFTDEEWRLVSELADHPNRLLVTATPESGETYAEVAHEAIFRRWNKLRNWIAVEREFLAWRTGLEAARRAWEGTPKRFKREALLMGAALILAQSWLKRRSKDIPAVDRAFTLRSRRQKIDKRVRIGVVMFVIFLLLLVPVLSDVWVRMQYQTRQEMDYALRDRANIALEKLVATIEADEVKAEGKPGKATASALGQFSWYQLYRFEPERRWPRPTVRSHSFRACSGLRPAALTRSCSSTAVKRRSTYISRTRTSPLHRTTTRAGRKLSPRTSRDSAKRASTIVMDS